MIHRRPQVATMLWLVTAAAGCSEAIGPDDGAPPGADVAEPFPLDRGDDGASTPGRYKGLWLRLVDNGTPTVSPVDAVIGVVCVGMSNAHAECADLFARTSSHWINEVSPLVRIVNCAVGGHAIESWIDPANDALLWEACIGRRLALERVRPDQVRVVYHKAANQFTTFPGGGARPTYPAPDSDFEVFRENLDAFAARVRWWFPSAQAVYTSARSYGGFAGTANRGEPLSYEEGHALNSWLAMNSTVDGIWYGWGAYLWAPECTTGITNGGGVCYDREDYGADGVHPSSRGLGKISFLMHRRLQREPWYRP